MTAIHSWSAAFRENELGWEEGRVTRASVTVGSQSGKGVLMFLNAQEDKFRWYLFGNGRILNFA